MIQFFKNFRARLDMETPNCLKHDSEWQMETHLAGRDGLS